MSDATADGAATGSAADVARSYFAAIARHDLDAQVSHWADGGLARLVGQQDLRAPEGVRGYFAEVYGAFPDFDFQVTGLYAAGDRVTVQWRATATFAGPGTFQGLEPTGARVAIEGCDCLKIAGGKIERNEAYFDGSDLARQLGVLPLAGSGTERRMTAAVNARTRLLGRFAAKEPERVADGVWVIRGGFPLRTMNVYLIEHGGKVTVYDAGIKDMTPAIAAAAARLGGIERVVLGHADPDHRGAASGLGAPVWCHPDEVENAEGDAGMSQVDFSKFSSPLARWFYPMILPHWDGGPVEIAGTLEEGDEVAGFRVVHLPGHAPGQIALWRESDRLALTSDCFYMLDVQTGRPGAARVPHPAFTPDVEQARASIRKLAALEPAAAWPGHVGPLTGDVRAELERAADTT